jgi:hypothetical protein
MTYAIQQFCPQVHKHTPAEERDENTGWLTLITFDNEADCKHTFDRPYSDGRARNERIIEVV